MNTTRPSDADLLSQQPNFNDLIAKHFDLEIPEGFQALPSRTAHSRHAGNANFLAKKVGDDLVIGYIFTDSVAWSWDDFSDSPVHHFNEADHRQAYIDFLQQDGIAHYPFYLNDSPHLVILSDDLQAVHQERVATEGPDAAKAFLKRTGRRLVADYDRWVKHDIRGAMIETWKQQGGLVSRDDCALVIPTGHKARKAFLGVDAAAAALREAMAQRGPAPRAAHQAAPGHGESPVP